MSERAKERKTVRLARERAARESGERERREKATRERAAREREREREREEHGVRGARSTARRVRRGSCSLVSRMFVSGVCCEHRGSRQEAEAAVHVGRVASALSVTFRRG